MSVVFTEIGERVTLAAGAVLLRGVGSKREVALVHRPAYNDWSLPKGKPNKKELAPATAVREVEEETGISGRITARLGRVDYTFVAQGRRIHKRVHHYLMEAVGGELSDADIEVTEVAWVPLADLSSRLAYAGERRLVRRAVELLADTA